MHLVKTKDMPGLTGLSLDQIREWTNRRALIPPDVKPKGSGSQAQFSWQTTLMLRIAASLRKEFHVELESYRHFLKKLHVQLLGTSFLSLWGKVVVIRGAESFDLVNDGVSYSFGEGVIVLPLAGHLTALSGHFGIQESKEQLHFFPAVGIR